MLPHFLSPTAFDDEALQARLPFWKRRELWLALLVLGLGLALYLPKLGDYALWDPWEPQYSQVGMEMANAGEWLVPLYRQGDHWWSKPILPLWMFTASFRLLGQTEFAARLPIVLTAIFGLVMMSFLIGRAFGWRVGLLLALILGTSPQFFFISRQAIFDGPYVTFQMIALGFMLVGLFRYPGNFRWMAWFWVFSALAMLCKGLLAIVVPAAVLGAYILATWEWGHLKRLRFEWGLPIFIAIAAPWFVFMTAKFGVAYLRDFFIYHHFERMAGMIKKPNNSFDLYVRQIFMATFPWSAFFPLAAVRALKRDVFDTDRLKQTLFVFLCFAMPYIFFSMGSTKFNHYIFPSVPFMALLVALYLEDLVLREKRMPRLDIILAICVLAILGKDIVTNYKYLIHLFIYYYDRALPDLKPANDFAMLFYGMGVLLFLPFVYRKLLKPALAAFALVVIAFMCYCNFVLEPPITSTFSMKPLLEAYQRLATHNEPICEFNSWTERSTTYYFENKSFFVNSTKPGEEKRFFSRPGKLFCMVGRPDFPRLAERVKQTTGRNLTIVDSSHPLQYLVATDDSPAAAVNPGAFVLTQAPPVAHAVRAEWAGKIRLLGYDTDKPQYRPGEPITVTLVFEVLDRVDKSYRLFIHGDQGQESRLNGDHLPAEGHYPTDKWQTGQFVRDIWHGTVPQHFEAGTMELSVGFFNESGRLPVSSGPNDGENRVNLASVEIQD